MDVADGLQSITSRQVGCRPMRRRSIGINEIPAKLQFQFDRRSVIGDRELQPVIMAHGLNGDLDRNTHSHTQHLINILLKCFVPCPTPTPRRGKLIMFIKINKFIIKYFAAATPLPVPVPAPVPLQPHRSLGQNSDRSVPIRSDPATNYRLIKQA